MKSAGHTNIPGYLIYLTGHPSIRLQRWSCLQCRDVRDRHDWWKNLWYGYILSYIQDVSWQNFVRRIGLCDVVGENTVRIYCPRCMDVYTPPPEVKGAAVDGAYFGTGLPHMVLMTRPEYIPSRPRGRHVAKLYGFRIHDSAYDLQRNAFTEYRRKMQQPPNSTSVTTAGITSTNNSTAAASSVVSTTDAASTTTTVVSSNASNQTSCLVNMINAYRRAPLLKRK